MGDQYLFLSNHLLGIKNHTKTFSFFQAVCVRQISFCHNCFLTMIYEANELKNNPKDAI